VGPEVYPLGSGSHLVETAPHLTGVSSKFGLVQGREWRVAEPPTVAGTGLVKAHASSGSAIALPAETVGGLAANSVSTTDRPRWCGPGHAPCRCRPNSSWMFRRACLPKRLVGVWRASIPECRPSFHDRCDLNAAHPRSSSSKTTTDWVSLSAANSSGRVSPCASSRPVRGPCAQRPSAHRTAG